MPKWTSRVLVDRIPLDREGWELRIYEKTWEDGSKCIDIQKWVKRENGSWSFYKPAQYIQLPEKIAGFILNRVAEAVA